MSSGASENTAAGGLSNNYSVRHNKKCRAPGI